MTELLSQRARSESGAQSARSSRPSTAATFRVTNVDPARIRAATSGMEQAQRRPRAYAARVPALPSVGCDLNRPFIEALWPKPRCSPPRAGALFAPGQHPPPFCAERTASRPTPPPLRPACFRSPQLTVAAPAASDAHPRPHGPSAGTAATSPECTPKISTGGHGRT